MRLDPIRKLDAILAASGARVTFDDRRYARAALDWPDFLPPMFCEAELAVEHWGKSGRWDTWTKRPSVDWPAPTVEVGQTWEQKSSLLATWEKAERAVYPLRILRHTVCRIDGERFLSDRGYHVPWAEIPGPNWRRSCSMATVAAIADALIAAGFPTTAPFVREHHGVRIHLPWVRGELLDDLGGPLTTAQRRMAERALRLVDGALVELGMAEGGAAS